MKQWLHSAGHVAAAGFLLATAPAAVAVQPAAAPLPEVADAGLGYSTVAAAMADLRSRQGVDFTTENGWTIATEETSYTIWSFAPAEYPAYPAVVRRRVVQREGNVGVEMRVLCEASKAACDDLVRTFAQMNGMERPR